MNRKGIRDSGKLRTGELIGHKNQMKFNPFDTTSRGQHNEFIWSNADYYPEKFKIELYRFLRDNIPLLNACIWTWSRLSSAPGRYEIIDSKSETEEKTAREYLDQMSGRIYPYRFQRLAGLESFLPLLFSSLYTDGAFAGFLTIGRDGYGIDRFIPVDPGDIGLTGDISGDARLFLQTDRGNIRLDGNDFYYFGLNSGVNNGLGKSIMGAIPFVAYIQQQLLQDMQKTTHNAGYHRLHVKIAPPQKNSGESDDAYIDRVNSYFDDTVSMIKSCDPEDNPVTWDNVAIEYIGPHNTRSVTNSWFLHNRAMVEEICAGTNLAPFMLGYSYGTTHNWAQFKYDLVMRQVVSIQRQTARFLEWMGNIELGLKRVTCRCRYVFDNRLSYLATEAAEIERSKADILIKLYSAGLISEKDAQARAGELI